MNKEQFIAIFGGMYEHSPWVAEAAFEHGPPDPSDTAALVAALREEVESAGAEAQRVLLRAHPDLAGKLAVQGGLTVESTAEQAGAGLDQCTAQEFERFQTLNAQYVKKFQFPFIMAVKGSERSQILAAFERRVDQSIEDEFSTAVAQVHRIAAFRVQAWAVAQGVER